MQHRGFDSKDRVQLMNELNTLPKSVMDAFDLKEWLKGNEPSDHLGEVEGGIYLAAKRHNAWPNTDAMLANGDIIHKYERKAFNNAKNS